MNFVILILAVWRVSSLLVQEDGPGWIFRRLRERTGITHDDQGMVFQIPDRFGAQVFSCVWCASVWVGLGWAVFYWLAPEIAVITAFPLALSAGAIGWNVMVKR